MPTALVTGASSGIGAEFSRQLAAKGADVVLVGRDEMALEHVAAEVRATGRQAEVLVADLLEPADLDRVIARVNEGLDVLVSNAGIGLPLAFERNDIETEVRHLRLHDEVFLRLTHAALPGMLERGSGRIIAVASVAAYLPRSTYGAVKAFLVNFCRWANVSYGPRGVTVTAVCPGFVHTNFHERLGLPPGQEGVPGWMWVPASAVVSEGLRDAARGKAVSIPTFRYKTISRLARILPATSMARMGRRGR